MTQLDLFKAPRKMHSNSLRTYREEKKRLDKRSFDVLKYFASREDAVTDRQVMVGMEFTDMDSVRPRITELRDDGFLMEVGKIKDNLTHKSVRATVITTLGREELNNG